MEGNPWREYVGYRMATGSSLAPSDDLRFHILSRAFVARSFGYSRGLRMESSPLTIVALSVREHVLSVLTGAEHRKESRRQVATLDISLHPEPTYRPRV